MLPRREAWLLIFKDEVVPLFPNVRGSNGEHLHEKKLLVVLLGSIIILKKGRDELHCNPIVCQQEMLNSQSKKRCNVVSSVLSVQRTQAINLYRFLPE
jgi:hypothetical protein